MSTRFLSHSTMALAFGAVALVAALPGCSDDYYCDGNACYSCDGVGCSQVNPPSRPTCFGDYQCPANQLCTDLGCATSCASEADCARGWVCTGASGSTRGLCTAPTEHPARTPGTCTTNDQCTGGTICMDGACRPATTTCQFNTQCGPGRMCVNQQCVAACTMDSQCPTGQRCRDSACTTVAGSECTGDAQCGVNRRCITGTCFSVCTTNAQCGSGLYCGDQGVCTPDTRRRPFCSTDAQCETGSRCVDGICRRPCGTSDECARTDVSYRNCASISYLHSPDRYCQTDHEVSPTCARQDQCAASQSCVDGVCRAN